MADSVDRVFVHALNTVKRIPRLGSARPPPAERLKLYGLYKQSMEGDVDGVMDRPSSDNGSGDGSDGRATNDELRADQQKWDAWNAQRGLSRTEAKRRYITTLIDTMRVYASQTADARELVTELEFVWDQIKSNPPSSSDKSPSSGRSYSSSHHPNSTSRSSHNAQAESASDQPIYPVMSERGSRHPRASDSKKRGREAADEEESDDRGLRVLSPISQGPGDEDMDADEEDDEEDEEEEGHGRRGPGDEYDTEEHEGEAFVDAPDSQAAGGDGGSQQYVSSSADERESGLTSPTSPARRRQPAPAQQQRNAASAIIEPIAKYIQRQRGQRPDGSTPESTAKWERRIESALGKMNAEMAALREQLDMQQQNGGGSVYSFAYPFSSSRRPSFVAGAPGRGRRGILAWLWDSMMSLTSVLVKHVVVDALVLALIMLWMHYRGIPPERLEELISGWIRRVRRLAFFRRLERIRQGETRLAIPSALRRANT